MPLRNPGDDTTEPEICIEGVYLTFGQAMALRVAASDFFQQMSEPDALGGDEMGLSMAKGYHDRISEVLRLMIGDRKK